MSEEQSQTPRRFSDEMLVRMDQKLEDNLEFVKKELQEIHNRLATLESFRSDIEKPVHAAGWMLVTLVGAFVVAVGAYVWKLMMRVHLG